MTVFKKIPTPLKLTATVLMFSVLLAESQAFKASINLHLSAHAW